MDKPTPLQFIAQALNDFMATMPPSVKQAFLPAAQHALNELEKELKPAEQPAKQEDK